MKLFNKVAIIGVGLIGGSIGLAIKKKNLAAQVIGAGHHQKSINQALKIKSIDEGSLDINSIKGAGLVVLAAPVREIINIIPKLSALLDKDCIVIDVGSTKKDIINAAQNSTLNFVGCHPLAGLEKKGVEFARADLFRNSLCILVKLKKTDAKTLQTITKIWEALGARTKILSADTHDKILAYSSHLPHIAAYSLINCIKTEFMKYASNGLKDTTRIASSDPKLWSDIFITNRKQIQASLKDFKSSLNLLETAISKNQPEALLRLLAKSKNKRDALK